MFVYLFTLLCGLVGGRYHNHGASGYNHPSGVGDLALAIPCDAGVVADVFVSYVRYA